MEDGHAEKMDKGLPIGDWKNRPSEISKSAIGNPDTSGSEMSETLC
jgi:hypothetical protein